MGGGRAAATFAIRRWRSRSAGFRVAMLAPDIHTWRDLRTGRVGRQRCDAVSVEHDGVPIYRRNDFTAMPRLPYRNPLAWTRCGMKLARRYFDENGRPDLVHAHSCLNAGVLALAIRRRYGIRFVVTEHSTGLAQGRLRWWERDLVRRVIKQADRCVAVSPHLAGLLHNQYPASSWQYLPNVLGEAFLPGAAKSRHRCRRRTVRSSFCASPDCRAAEGDRSVARRLYRGFCARSRYAACAWSGMDQRWRPSNNGRGRSGSLLSRFRRRLVGPTSARGDGGADAFVLARGSRPLASS